MDCCRGCGEDPFNDDSSKTVLILGVGTGVLIEMLSSNEGGATFVVPTLDRDMLEFDGDLVMPADILPGAVRR